MSAGPGQASVYGRDASTGRIVEARWSSSRATWIGWHDLGGAPTAAGTDLSAVARGSTTYLFSISTKGQLQVRAGTDGHWGRDHTLAPFRVNGGPASVRVGGAISTLVRRASDGRVVLVTWQLPGGQVRSTVTNVQAAAGTGPGVATVDGRTLRAAVLTPGAADRRRVGVFSLDPTRRGASVKSQVSLLSGGAAGSPAVGEGPTANTATITVRSISGAVQQQDRPVRGARSTMSGWGLLGSRPAGTASGDGPATLTFQPTAAAPRTRSTFLPTADGRTLLQHTAASGWVRFALGASGADGASVAPSTLSQPAAVPASTATSSPTPLPSPTPTPTPPPQPSLDGSGALPPGTIRYFGRTSHEGGWDSWLHPVDTPATARAHILRNVWRLELFANNDPVNNGALATSWFPGGMVYRQLYTIDPATAAAHPSWVMRTAAGVPLYVDDGVQPRGLIAGNIFNPAFRAWMISHAAAGGGDQGGPLQTVAAGRFAGLWLDNVNPELLGSGLVTQDGTWVGETRGGPVYAPYNQPAAVAAGEGQSESTCADQEPATTPGLPITDACWAQGITVMLAELRKALPLSTELLVNVPWYRTQRDPSTYSFIDQPTPAFKITPTPPVPGPLAGGLWTAHGKAITDSATYVNIEGSFWANASASGSGYGAAVGAGRSTQGYSLDMMFRYIDALHRRGKGFVADNWMDRARLDVGPQPAGSTDDPLLRVQEFNLAGYLLATDGRDGIGDFNPRSDGRWPAITGSGGSTLYGMDIGTAAARPAGALDPKTNVDDPGPGANGRGVAAFGATYASAADGLGPLDGNRVWVRAFVRRDGKRVFVLLAEPAPRPTLPDRPYDRTAGGVLSYAPPIGAAHCTNMTRASDASYARWDAAAGTARLGPASALFLLCDAAGA